MGSRVAGAGNFLYEVNVCGRPFRKDLDRPSQTPSLISEKDRVGASAGRWRREPKNGRVDIGLGRRES